MPLPARTTRALRRCFSPAPSPARAPRPTLGISMRPGGRAAPRTGLAAALAGALDRGRQSELRRGSVLRLSETPLRGKVAEHRRCRWRTTRRSSSSGCSATAARRGACRAPRAGAQPAGFGAGTIARRWQKTCRPAIAHDWTATSPTCAKSNGASRWPRSRIPPGCELPAAPTGIPDDFDVAREADVRPAGAGLAGGRHAQ